MNNFLYTVLALLMVTACSRHDHQGYVFPQYYRHQLHIGRTTPQQVIDLFGAPTTTSDYGDPEFYYISQEQVSSTFSRSKVVDQEVLALQFKGGILRQVRYYTKQDLRNITNEKSSTKLLGNEMGMFEQVWHNIGRFKADKKGKE